MAIQIKSPNISRNNVGIPYFSVLGVLAVIVIFTLLWRPLNLDRTTYVPLNPQINSAIVEQQRLPAVLGDGFIELLNNKPLSPPIIESSDTPEDVIAKDDLDDIIDDKNVMQYTISRGDTLHDILIRYNVNRNDIYQLTTQFKQLANLRIGQQISWITNDDNTIQTFSWAISSNNVRIYERSGNKFVESTETAESVSKNITI